MKLTRGNYPGASQFAQFDTNPSEMTLDQCRDLLENILHRAMPGEPHADLIYRELSIAEENWKAGQP